MRRQARKKTRRSRLQPAQLNKSQQAWQP